MFEDINGQSAKEERMCFIKHPMRQGIITIERMRSSPKIAALCVIWKNMQTQTKRSKTVKKTSYSQACDSQIIYRLPSCCQENTSYSIYSTSKIIFPNAIYKVFPPSPNMKTRRLCEKHMVCIQNIIHKYQSISS